MAAPANRVPVRIARGTKAALDADLGSIYEGEIVYATDEDTLYMKEGGVLVAAGTAGSGGGVSGALDLGGDWVPASETGAIGFMRPLHFYERLDNAGKPTLAKGKNQWSFDVERQSNNCWIYVSVADGGWNESDPGSTDFSIGTPTGAGWYKTLFDAGLLDKDAFNEGDISIGMCFGNKCAHGIRLTAMEYVEDGTNQYWGFRVFNAGLAPQWPLIDFLRSWSDTTTGTNAILDGVLGRELRLYLPLNYNVFDVQDYDDWGNQLPQTGSSLRMQSWGNGNLYWTPNGADGYVKAINGRFDPDADMFGNTRVSLYDVGLGQDYEITAGTNTIDAYWDIQLIGGPLSAPQMPATQGEYRLYNKNSDDDLYLLIAPIDMDGVDHTTTLQALAADESNMWVAFVYENVLYGPIKHSNTLSNLSGYWRFYMDAAIANRMNIGRDALNIDAKPDGTNKIRLLVGHGMDIALKALTDGQTLVWDSKAQGFMSGPKPVPLDEFKVQTALSTDFTDFQARIATLT